MNAERSTSRQLQEKTQDYALTWWPVYVLLIPMIAALAVYWKNPRDESAETTLLFASIVVGLEIVLIAVKHLKSTVVMALTHAGATEDGSTRVLNAALSSPHFAGARELLEVMFAIQRAGNPLMKRLANDQVSDLATFLRKFDKALPFIRGSELITIERHYTSFMQAIGAGGEYVATTLPNFWIEEDAEILQSFFHSQAECASNGILIRRVFLLTPENEENPRVRSLLRKHAQISRKYANGGLIETKILRANSINPNEDDFGIYLLNGEPAAIAIGRFTLDTLQLQGNDVLFDPVVMRRKLNLFHDRFEHAISIEEFLLDDGPTIFVGTIEPGSVATR